MDNKNIKRGIYTSPQSGTQEFERYVIENQEDLKEFKKAFCIKGHIWQNLISEFERNIKKGYTIIATDPNPLHGMPTWCFESKDPNNTHPSSFHRVRLIENK